MATTIRRLADSCLLVTHDGGTDLIDPGFFTYDHRPVDLDTIGDVQRVLITHEHGDHVKPEFVRWLLDRGDDVSVHANQAVVDVLARHDIEASTGVPAGLAIEDVTHEVIPTGAAPPNRAWHVEHVLTHPGDSYQVAATHPVLALPLMAPWGSMTASVEFARRLGPEVVVPIHDFYMSSFGREWSAKLAEKVLAADGIEVAKLDWGDSFSF